MLLRIIKTRPGGDYFFIPLHVAEGVRDTGLISGQPRSLFVSGKGGAPASSLVSVLESVNGHQLGLAGFSEESRGAQWSTALELTLQQLFSGQHGFLPLPRQCTHQPGATFTACATLWGRW